VKMFDADKTRMIGLPYGEKKTVTMLSRFRLIPERYGQTEGRTDRRTDRIAISISRVSRHVFCTSLRHFVQIGPPSAENNDVMSIFKMADLSHLRF